jgi:hypothetical protein
MTSTVTQTTRHAFESMSYSHLTSTLGLVVVVLLIVLLLEGELIRAFRGGNGPSLRTLQVAIAPLLLSFVVIVVTRFVLLIR